MVSTSISRIRITDYRNLLTESKALTEIEKEFYTELPRSLDDYDVISQNSSGDKIEVKVESVINEEKTDDWYWKLLEYGTMYFVDLAEPYQILSDLKNNADSSSIDYKFPENIAEYIISMNNCSNTTDELAINYLLKTTQFNTTEDLLKSVGNTKNDLIKLHELNVIRESFWKYLIRRDIHTQQNLEHSNFMTNKDTEYIKKIEVLKSFIEDKKTKISDLDKTKNYYIALLNDLYFYMKNIQKIFDQVSDLL